MLENGDKPKLEDRPHVKPGAIKLTKGYATRRIFSRLINFMIVLLIFSIVALAIFVYIKQPVKTENGYVMAEPIYEMLEHGEKIVVVNDEGFHLFTPLKRFLFTQEVYNARVIAGPYGKIEQMNGKFRVADGVNVISVNLKEPQEYLDMEYAVRKIDENDDFVKDELDEIITKEKALGKMIVE